MRPSGCSSSVQGLPSWGLQSGHITVSFRAPEGSAGAGSRPAGERALPDVRQQLLEPGEIPRPQLDAPFALDVAQDLEDLRLRGTTPPGDADHPRPALVRGVGAGEIAGRFEALEKLVHGLLAHAGALRQRAGPDPVGARVLEHRHVRQPQVLEPGGVEIPDDPPVDRLGRHPQQGADQQLARREGRGGLGGVGHGFLLGLDSAVNGVYLSLVNGVYHTPDPEEALMTPQTLDLRVNPAAETLRLGPLGIRFLITGAQSNGSLAAFELTVPAGQRLEAPPHSHDHYEETIYGIAGVMTWTVNGTAIAVGPGEALCIPRGAVHRFDNLGGEDAKALCVVSPAAIGPEYFREAAAVLAAGGPPDKAKLAEIMIRHGLTPAPPPRA